MKLSEDQECGIIGAIGILILVLGLLAMSGCANSPQSCITADGKTTCTTIAKAIDAEDTIKAGITDAAIAAAKAPLFKLTCPTTGCLIGSLEVGNPASAGQLSEVMKVAFQPQVSEAGQNYRATIGALAQVGGYAVIGNAVSNIFGKITDGYVGMASKIQAPGAITTTTNTTNTATTNTLSGTGSLGSGSYNAPISTITNPTAKNCVVVPATATAAATIVCN